MGVARGEYMSVGGEYLTWYLLKLHSVTILLHGFRFKFIFLLLVGVTCFRYEELAAPSPLFAYYCVL